MQSQGLGCRDEGARLETSSGFFLKDLNLV